MYRTDVLHRGRITRTRRGLNLKSDYNNNRFLQHVALFDTKLRYINGGVCYVRITVLYVCMYELDKSILSTKYRVNGIKARLLVRLAPIIILVTLTTQSSTI